LYRSVFYELLSRCREVAGGHGFRFKNKLLSLDATLIELCATVFKSGLRQLAGSEVALSGVDRPPGLVPTPRTSKTQTVNRCDPHLCKPISGSANDRFVEVAPEFMDVLLLLFL